MAYNASLDSAKSPLEIKICKISSRNRKGHLIKADLKIGPEDKIEKPLNGSEKNV